MVRCQHCNKDLTGYKYHMESILCFKCFDIWQNKIKENNEKEKEKEDVINKPNHKEILKPSHYHDGTYVDPIRYGKEHFTHEEMKGFYKMNIIKYVTRSDKKNGLEDLIKAKNYLEMLIENVGNDYE